MRAAGVAGLFPDLPLLVGQRLLVVTVAVVVLTKKGIIGHADWLHRYEESKADEKPREGRIVGKDPREDSAAVGDQRV